VIDISTENRLKEIAGNLKKDVKELLSESARIVTGVFKQGHCTAKGAANGWKRFTNGISNLVRAINDPDLFAPVVLPGQEPLVTVKESACEDLPAGTRMTLSEAEQRIGDINESLWASDEPAKEVKVIIDYRMDNEQDRYCLPVVIGAGRQPMLAQMKEYVETSLQHPDMVCQDFYAAPPGLDKLLHEYFGPQFQEDLERLGNRVLVYFEQHCTISQLEQQFEKQAQAMPKKDQHRFRESAKRAVTALRRAANTGQEPSVPDREATEQAIPKSPAPSPEKTNDRKPRQSVKVQLRQIKEAQSTRPVIRKSRDDPQR